MKSNFTSKESIIDLDDNSEISIPTLNRVNGNIVVSTKILSNTNKVLSLKINVFSHSILVVISRFVYVVPF